MKELAKWFRGLPAGFKGLIAGSIIVELIFYTLLGLTSAAALSQAEKLRKLERAVISPRQLPSLEKIISPKTEAKKASSAKETVLVTKVLDGDTIEVEGHRKVRYIGIDCPEKDKPYSEEALAANRKLVEGRVVLLVKDVLEKDVYGRLLRYVYVGDVFVNARLVKEGFAEAKAYPPDTTHEDEFEKLEKEAIEAGKGIWTRPAQSPTPSVQPFPNQQEQQPTVYINEPGVEYHLLGCQRLGSNSKAISLTEAKARGYTACDLCKAPP